MSKQQDGGPFFPTAYESTEQDGWTLVTRPDPGASLRDAFAMAALTGVLASQEEHWDITKGDQEEFFARVEKGWAEFCYRQADAMLRAREQEGTE